MSGSGAIIYRDERALPKAGGSSERVTEVLFKDTKTDIYAVLDGASDPNVIYNDILQSKLDFRCLYRGELDDDLKLCAPYLVRFNKPSPIVLKLIKAMFETNSGIIARLEKGTDIDLVRRHFRKYLLVRTPEKKTVYFRYYDPRVFRTYLPTCNEEELNVVFGANVERFVVPTGDGFGVRAFDPVLEESTI